LNMKMLALSLIALSAVLCTPLVNAQAPQPVTAWTDKPKYAPGEKGTLYIAFYNERDVAVEIKNLTIIYAAWNAYINGAWMGNATRTVSVPLSSGAVHVFSDITFTVPTDGRAVSTDVDIKIGTDRGYKSGSSYINVPDTPKYMEQIITLFTIQVVLLIVCTIIIAATIFLSVRRPQVTWKKEAAEE